MYSGAPVLTSAAVRMRVLALLRRDLAVAEPVAVHLRTRAEQTVAKFERGHLEAHEQRRLLAVDRRRAPRCSSRGPSCPSLGRAARMIKLRPVQAAGHLVVVVEPGLQRRRTRGPAASARRSARCASCSTSRIGSHVALALGPPGSRRPAPPRGSATERGSIGGVVRVAEDIRARPRSAPRRVAFSRTILRVVLRVGGGRDTRFARARPGTPWPPTASNSPASFRRWMRSMISIRLDALVVHLDAGFA